MFAEISLNVLDIAENSLKAGADIIEITIEVKTAEKRLRVEIKDNGSGMNPTQADACKDPFFTSRTTRKVGLGIPFFKQSAECTGGTFSLSSREGHGTCISAVYHTDHIDCMPLGDINATIYLLIIMNETVDFIYRYKVDEREFQLDTKELRSILGEISFQSSDVAAFIRDFLAQNKREVDQENII